MDPLRLVECELAGGVEESARKLVFTPGFNVIVGDVRSGKTSLVRSLVGAFRGKAPGLTANASAQKIRVDLQAADERLQVYRDWNAPSIELLRVPADAAPTRLFYSQSWGGLLEEMERHTGLSGLASTCLLSADNVGLTLPRTVVEYVSRPILSPEAIQRRKLQDQRADLLREQEEVAEQTRHVESLRARLAPQAERFQGIPEDFLELLSDLLRARQDLQRLKTEEAEHQVRLEKARIDLETSREEVDGSYAPYHGLGPEYPRHMKRFKELETELTARMTALDGLREKLGGLTGRLGGFTFTAENGFDERIATLVADQSQMRLEPIDAELDVQLQQAMDALSVRRFDTETRYFLLLLSQLGTYRRELIEVQERVQLLQVQLYQLGLQGVLHQQAASWPDRFPDQLGQVRHQQHVLLQASQEKARLLLERHPLHDERDRLVAQLEDLDGLHEEPADFDDRLETLVQAQQDAPGVADSVADMHRQVAEIDTALAAEHGWRAGFGDDYPTQVEQVRQQLAEVAEKRRGLEEAASRKEALVRERAAIAQRLEAEFEDLKGQPADLPDRLQSYVRLGVLEKELESQRQALETAFAERRKRRDDEFGEFSHLDVATVEALVEVRPRDALLYRQWLRLDADLRARLAAESQLAELNARLKRQPLLPDGIPVLTVVAAEHAKWLADIDGQLAELDQTMDDETFERLKRVTAAWAEHKAQQRQRARLTEELASARTYFDSVQAELRKVGLPLEDADVKAWDGQRERLVALLAGEAGAASKARSTRKLNFLGRGAEEAEAKEKLAAVDAEKARLVARWKLTSVDEVPALLDKDRVAREQLASARSKIDYIEKEQKKLASAAPDEDLQRDAEALGVAASEDPVAMVAEVAGARQRQGALKQQRTMLAAAAQHLYKPLAELPPTTGHLSATDAYERQARWRDDKQRVEARLELLRPVEELESERDHLLDWVTRGLSEATGSDTPPETVVRLLQYQAMTHEVAESQAALQRWNGGAGQTLQETVARRRAMHDELGAILAADVDVTVARHQEWTRLTQQAADLDAQRAELEQLPSLAALDAMTEAARGAMERLHLRDEEAIPEALKDYAAYQFLMDERSRLRRDAASNAEALHVRLDQAEKALGRWSRPLAHGDVDVATLRSRWNEARAVAGHLRLVDEGIAALPTREELQADIRRLEDEGADLCRQLGVAVDSSEDLDLLRRWSDYTAWRQHMEALQDELSRCLRTDASGMHRIELLERQIRKLESSLSVAPGDDVEEVREDFVSAQSLRTQVESLLARQVEFQAQEDTVGDYLRQQGLARVAGGATASLLHYAEYGRLVHERRETERDIEVLEKTRNRTSLADLEEEMEQLRPHLGGREKLVVDANVEAATYADFVVASTRRAERETLFASLRDDSRPTDDRQRAEGHLRDLESRLGEWLDKGTPGEIQQEYEFYLTARGDVEQRAAALAERPSLDDLTRRIDALEFDLKMLEPDEPEDTAGPAARALEETLERSRTRASEILARVSSGRYQFRFDEETPVVIDEEGTAVEPQSEGVQRLSELCWRLGVCLSLEGAHPWPVILDEPFDGLSTVDQMEMTEFLLELAAQRQVIILTSHRDLALDVTIDLNQEATVASE